MTPWELFARLIAKRDREKERRFWAYRHALGIGMSVNMSKDGSVDDVYRTVVGEDPPVTNPEEDDVMRELIEESRARARLAQAAAGG